MPVRPASVSPEVWRTLSVPTQNALANSAGLAAAQRSDVQRAAWQRVRALQAGGGGSSGAPSGGGVSGGAAGGVRPGGAGGGGSVRDLKSLLGTSSSKQVAGDAGLLEKLFHAAGFSGSLDSILRQLDLGYSFAGAEQFRQNQAGAGGALGPALQNVSMQSIVSDPASLERVVGEMMGMLERGQDVQALWRQRSAGVPEWAGQVYDDLRQQNVPWSTELFGSPEVNYTDPSKPLFPRGSHPQSLLGLTGSQAGEEAFYQGLSAAELMSQIFPAYSAYYHRPAGAEAPSAGLMFGAADESGVPASPVRNSDLYARWSAYGQPGNQVGPFSGVHGLGGAQFDPFTGAGSTGSGSGKGANPALAAAIASGQLTPDMLGDPATYDAMVRSLFGTVGAAALDPNVWWDMEYNAPYAPWNLDPATLQRLMATIYGVPVDDGSALFDEEEE